MEKIYCFLFGHHFELDKYSICMRCDKQYDKTLKFRFTLRFKGATLNKWLKKFKKAYKSWFVNIVNKQVNKKQLQFTIKMMKLNELRKGRSYQYVNDYEKTN